MTCETLKISCEIANLVEAVGQATPWEKAGVVVAAIAALGTIWIAILNLRILHKQQKLARSQMEWESRERRFDLADAITLAIKDIAIDIATGVNPMNTERAQEHLLIMMSARRLNEPANERIVKWALDEALAAAPDGAVLRVTEIAKVVGDWAANPSSESEWLLKQSV
jgi:hypothetical protein